MPRQTTYSSITIVTIVTCLLVPAAMAASVAPVSVTAPGKSVSGYDQPRKEILDVLHAPSPPVANVSPTQDNILLVAWQDYPAMARVATPFLRLAGVRIEPKNHSKHDTPGGYGIKPCARSFALVNIASGKQTALELPVGACPESPQWSADGKRFAFTNIAADSVELWVGEVASGKAHKVPGARLNPMFNGELQWMPDQKTLLVKLVPDGMGAPPAKPLVPSGPSIQETGAEKGQSSTYENRDTLGSKHDEDLFDYYAAAQPAFVDASSSVITRIGKPGNYESLDPAPDGKHLLVTAIHKPYSYVTTYERFPQNIDVWDVSNRAKILIQNIASLPLADRVPIHGVPVGPRQHAWRATEPATLVWVEALDGGDWNVKVPSRDKVLMQKAPFTVPALEIARTEQR
ncbi:MAG: hypothetical protein Q7T25_09420, partial [Sideroxyarcus sp.]|nr:hypothetical protein [Sideroxyarcus sp.]